MRTLHKRSLMPAAIGVTAIVWIARVLSGRLVTDRGDRSDSGDYMRTSLKKKWRRLGRPRSLGSPVFYPGDWSQTGAIEAIAAII